MQSRRKTKQSAGRHGQQFWEDEKGSIGYRLMQKQGWDLGQGLGKTGTGNTKYIRTKQKKNNCGIGADIGTDDNWSATQGLFNDLLARLNTKPDEEFDPCAEPEEEKQTTSGQALKTYLAKRQLYHRFKKSKDVGAYSKNDLSEIFGTKKKRKPKFQPKKQDPSDSSVMTTTSSVSMKDYFAKKLAASSKKVTQFQSASGNGFTMDQQADYYDRKMAASISGKRGLGFGSASSGLGYNGGNTMGLGSRTGGLGFVSSSTPTPTPATQAESVTESDTSAKKKKKKSKKNKAAVVETEKKKKKKKKSKNTEASSTPAADAPVSAKSKKKNKKRKRADIESTAPTDTSQQESKKSKKKKQKKEKSVAASAPATVVTKVKKSKKKKKKAKVE